MFLLARRERCSPAWHKYPLSRLIYFRPASPVRPGVLSAFEKATSAVRAAAVDDRDSRHARDRLPRQNDGLRREDVQL